MEPSRSENILAECTTSIEERVTCSIAVSFGFWPACWENVARHTPGLYSMNTMNVGWIGDNHDLATCSCHEDVAHFVSNEVNGTGEAPLKPVRRFVASGNGSRDCMAVYEWIFQVMCY